jgi:hypothetical protein
VEEAGGTSQDIAASHQADTARTRMKKPAPIKISHSGPPNLLVSAVMQAITKEHWLEFPLWVKPQKN